MHTELCVSAVIYWNQPNENPTINNGLYRYWKTISTVLTSISKLAKFFLIIFLYYFFFSVCLFVREFFFFFLCFVYALYSEHYWSSLWQHCQELEKMKNLSDEFQFSSHMTVLCSSFICIIISNLIFGNLILLNELLIS